MCTYKINRLFTSAPHDKDKTVSIMMDTESIFTHMREHSPHNSFNSYMYYTVTVKICCFKEYMWHCITTKQHTGNSYSTHHQKVSRFLKQPVDSIQFTKLCQNRLESIGYIQFHYSLNKLVHNNGTGMSLLKSVSQ